MTIIPDNWRELAWKTAIYDCASDAVAYFVPELHADMDTSKEIIPMTPWKFLREKVGQKALDSLVFLDVPMRGGGVICGLFIIGGQIENANDFMKRAAITYYLLCAERPFDTVSQFILYTGDSENVNVFEMNMLGPMIKVEFRTFHLLSQDVEELRRDQRAFARLLYAGRMAHESGDDLTLREKYARELLVMADGNCYDDAQRKVILEFSQRIFRLSDPNISEDLKAAYDKRTQSLKALNIRSPKKAVGGKPGRGRSRKRTT
ncbi:MAG: hypothetical protein LBF58_02095 [Deltaproteobacteria bacterium]|jgi:hypothetical protein|nr:hypothetical protein [Deltaproteobacteria bacterium]